MRRTSWLILGAAGVGGLVAVARAVAGRAETPAPPATHSVTVMRPVAYVTEKLPRQLTERGDAIDLLLLEAPGGRGTEIHVRRANDSVSDGEIRRTLRNVRSQLEVGDVLQPGVATTTPTLLNKALRAVTGRGREKGLL